jgi:hypothetical protein
MTRADDQLGAFANVAVASGGTILAASSGKKFHITRLNICGDVAGAYVVFEAGGTTITAFSIATNGCSAPIVWANSTGYVFSTTNTAMTVLGPSASHTWGNACGTAE